ncbi:MAG: beta strand repeat-containing protein, partial [Phascolarctobacterium sp.]
SYTSKSGKSFVINVDGDYVYSDPNAKDESGQSLYGEIVPENDRPDSLNISRNQGKYYVLDTAGNKQYLVANGSAYVYEDTGEAANLYTLRSSLTYNEDKGKFYDASGRAIVVNTNRSYTLNGSAVDVTATAAANIVDLNADAALANANGSTGVDFGLSTDANGNLNEAARYTSQNVTVQSSGNVIVGSAIGVAVKVGGETTSVGAAAATNVNDVTNSFNAEVSGGTINVSGRDGVSVKAESKTVMVAVAAGAAVSAGSSGLATVDVAGSGVANTIDNDTIATVENSSITAYKLDVDATTNSTLVGVAGQLSTAVTSQYGGVAGLTWTQNDFNNTTGAYVRGISLDEYNVSTVLDVNAYNNSDMYTIGAGVGVAVANGAISGAYAANYGNNSTEAVVEKYTGTDAINDSGKNEINNAIIIGVKAEDDSDMVTVAGSLDVAVSPSSAAVTVGGAVANTNIGSDAKKQKVHASLDDADITMTNQSASSNSIPSEAAAASVQALNDANVVNLALGGGVAVGTGLAGVSVEGSVSVADVHSETLASMNNLNLTGSNNDVTLLAQSDGDIVSSADAFGVAWGGSAGVGAGATVSVLNSDVDTKADVNGGTWSVKSAQINARGTNSLYDIAMGFSVGGSTVAAVNGQANVAVNTLDNDVEALVHNIDITTSGDVSVEADSDETLHNYAGLLAGSGSATASVGIGATVVVNTINGDTVAEIQNGTLYAEDVDVHAHNKRRVNSSQTGIGIAASAEGAGSVVGSVSVHDLEGTTKALVHNVNGSVHSLDVNAERDNEIDTYNNGFALSGAVASGSVGVGVTVLDDKSATLATLSSSSLTASGSKDNTNKVHVTADNDTNVHTEVSTNTLAASLGAAVGVAVEVVNLDAQVGTLVSTSTLGSNSAAFAEFDAQANNNLTNTFQNVTDATSTIGALTVGVGVLNINSQTTTNVDNTKAYADDVQILAEEIRNVNTVLAGATIGAVAVGVNLMYTNIGGQLANVYSYDYGDGGTQKAYYTTNPENGSLPLAADVQGLTNDALATTKADVTKVESDGLVTSGSSDKDILQTVNKGSGTGKVETKITGGSELHAAQNLAVQATTVNRVTGGVYQGSVDVVNVGVMANRIDVQENQQVVLDNATLIAEQVHVDADVLGYVNNTMGMGVVGAVGYSDVVAEVQHSGTNSVNIAGSTISATGQSSTAGDDQLQINASNSMTMDNQAVAVGAESLCLGRTVLKGSENLAVNVTLGNAGSQAANSFTAESVAIKALNAPNVKNHIGAGVNVGLVTGHGTIVESDFGGSVGVSATSSNAFTTGKLALTGQIGELIDHSTVEENRKYTTQANNLAVNVTLEDISVNKAITTNNAQLDMNVGAISLANGQAAPDVEISALNYATSKAKVESYSITGVISIGTNFAETEDNSTINLAVDGGTTGIKAKNLLVQAEKKTEVYSNAYGATSGLVDTSPYAAAVDHASTSNITVNIEGKISATGALNVQANGNDRVNLKADALTVTGAGEGDAHVDTSITSNTIINVKDASLTSGGNMSLLANNDISLNKGESKSQPITDPDDIDLNDNNEYSEMLWGQGYGLGDFGTSGITNSVASTAKVLLNDADLLSEKGAISLAGYTNEDLLVNGYTYAVGFFLNLSVTNVENTITNEEAVELDGGSTIITQSAGQDISLSAADDVKLFTYALTETPAGVAGSSNAELKDTITRINTVALKNDKNSLYSTQDVNLYAGKKLDGSVAVLDLDAEAMNYNGNVIPIVLNPSLENVVSQTNTVRIDEKSTSNSVRHTNIYADAGQELVRVLAARDTGYGGSSNGGYVTEASGDEKYEKTSNNKVDINGSVTAGSGNVIHITIGDPGDIAIFDADDRAALTGKTALDKEGLKGHIKIEADPITGITLDSITLDRANYSLILANRYNEVMRLMNEYAKDGTNSAAYLGYKAEADRLMQEMLAYGSVYKDNNGQYHMTASNYVDYVELPQLVASGGNINIQTDTVRSSSGKGSMQANGSADINIVNNTNLLLKLDNITVDSDGGKIIYNNQVVTPDSDTTTSFNEKLTALNQNGTKASFAQIDAKAGAGSSISVLGNYSGASLNYKYLDGNTMVTGQYKPMADIWIEGSILNQTGAVTITSAHNNIRIAAENPQESVAILGTTVALTAGGSISQNYTAGIVNVGGNVKDDYENEYQQMINDKKDVTVSVSKEGAPNPNSKATGSYIAGGSIYINATDININGVIQSGYGDYYLDLSTGSNDYTAVNTAITKIKQSYTETGSPALSDDAVKGEDAYKVVDGGAYWDSNSACYKYKLNAYYNPFTDKIIVEDVDASGGKVYLTGRIVNTGYGNIVCLDGASNISITNSTQHRLQVGDLLTHDVEGIISITDTAGYTVKKNGKDTSVALVTTIKSGSTEVQYLDSNGQAITPDAGSQINRVQKSTSQYYDYTYAPKTGLRYTWTSGKASTQYKRYEETEVDGAWGLWSRDDLNTSEVLKEWSVDETPIEEGTNNNADRLSGAVIKDSNNNGSTIMDYTHTETTEHVYTVESDTVVHSGVFGCHENHDVIWTETWGDLETYYADVKADQYINISFVGNKAETAKIDITSPLGVDITGNIGNTQVYKNDGAVTEKGLINIKAGAGSITQNGGNLYGSAIDLRANQGIKNINIVAGDNVALLLMNMGSSYVADANITVNNALGAKGNLALATTQNLGGSAWGNLEITNNSNVGDIWQINSNDVSAARIDLTTINGSVYGAYGKDSDFVVNVKQSPVNTDDSLSASLNASAYGNINIKQSNGDLRLGRVYSKTGDVALTAAGSIVDALPTETASKGTVAERLARWQSLGMIAGTGSNSALVAIKNRLNQEKGLADYEQYDANALLYTVSESIVNPNGSSLPKTSSKDPNVIGHNITLTAGASVGYVSDAAESITLTGILKKNAEGTYANENALTQLQTLANANITNVSVKTENGNTIAVVQDKQAVGVQQITSLANPENGKLTVTANGSDNKGNILIEGRQEIGNDKLVGSDKKDLYVQSITAPKGEINLTSLGGIFNNAGSNVVNVTGKSLYITAVDALGAANNKLATDIFGTDKSADGLSAVAGGNIYLDQTSDHNLILRNVSSSAKAEQGEIYLGANKSILMGTNGTSEDYYLRADGVELTIEARGGSIGEAVNGNAGVSHTDNDGVRIKNVGTADAASKVILKVKDNVYVKGVTSSSTGEAAQGVLNLEVAPVSGATLQNIGIVVDGNLHLLDALNSSSSASVYTTIDLLLDNNIEEINSKDIYLGSAGDITVAGTEQINGTNSVTVQAGNDVLLETGYLASKIVNLQANAGKIDEKKGFVLYTPTVNATAKGDILLDSHVNQLQQVNVANTKGSIAVGNGNVTNAALTIAITTPDAVVGGDLTVHNYAKGEANNIVLADKLTATGDISIINEEANVAVGAAGDISAKNITLQAVNNNVVVAGGKLTAADKVMLNGVNVAVSGGTVQAAEAKLEADNAISLSGGSITANEATFTAGSSIGMSSGSITSATTVLTATGGAITESDGFRLDAALVKAKAAGAISLAGQNNQLVDVLVANTDGDVTIYNGNTTDKNLNIAVLNEGNEGAKVNGSLTVRNYNNNNGLANELVLNNKLTATGNISLINDEADITVGVGAALSAQNITLQADNNAVIVDGGAITATSDNSAAGIVALDGNSVQLKSGTITAKTTNLTSDTIITENEGFVMESPVLNSSAVGDITLASRANQLEQVNIVSAGNDVTIGSVNSKNSNALQIKTNAPIVGDLSVTNYQDNSGYNNIIEVPAQLQAGGTITLTNEETGITVDEYATINANNVVLKAVEITVDGNITARNDASLDSDTGLAINGNVTAYHDTSLTAGTAINVAGEVSSTNATSLNAS